MQIWRRRWRLWLSSQFLQNPILQSIQNTFFSFFFSSRWSIHGPKNWLFSSVVSQSLAFSFLIINLHPTCPTWDNNDNKNKTSISNFIIVDQIAQLETDQIQSNRKSFEKSHCKMQTYIYNLREINRNSYHL